MSQRRDHNRGNSRNESLKFQDTWIKSGIDDEAIKYAKQKGRDLKNKDLTTSQIRNVFGEMRRIQMRGVKKEMRSLLLIKPKLAYNARRHRNKGVEELSSVFEQAYNALDLNGEKIQDQYNNLMDLFEAILAYHKFFGGKE